MIKQGGIKLGITPNFFLNDLFSLIDGGNIPPTIAVDLVLHLGICVLNMQFDLSQGCFLKKYKK